MNFSLKKIKLPMGTNIKARAINGYALPKSIFCNTHIHAIVVIPYRESADSRYRRVSIEKKLPVLCRIEDVILNRICPTAIPITQNIATI